MAEAELPGDFAEKLARVLEPSEHEAAAEIIEAATMLDDIGLRRFLLMFANRIGNSSVPVRADELMEFLQLAAT